MNRLVLKYTLQNRLICCAFFLMLFNSSSAIAQLSLMDDRKINHSGKDFWLTLHESPSFSFGDVMYILTITGAHDAHITFDYTTPGLAKSYYLRAGTILRIQLSVAEANAIGGGLNSPVGVVTNKSMHISSDTDVNVQFHLVGGANDDGIMILPSDKQNYGNDYYLNSTKTTVFSGPLSGYSIVCRCDSVVLEITPSVTTVRHAAGVPFLVTMKKGGQLCACRAGTSK